MTKDEKKFLNVGWDSTYKGSKEKKVRGHRCIRRTIRKNLKKDLKD